MKFDRRLTPAREDVAAIHLQGTVRAPRYATPEPARIALPVVPLRPRPSVEAALDTELLFGERFNVYDRADGWAWGQSELDNYVGYVPENALAPTDATATHRVATLGANTYTVPALKSPPVGTLPFAACVSVAAEENGFSRIGPDIWVPVPQIAPAASRADDWVTVAEMFVGVPYVWGGRSSAGLDCSALIQLSCQAAGHTCPRDSDMQEAALGQTLAPDAALRRGDLLFWRGHVGVMLDETRLLHANGHHMSVRIEQLDAAIARIAAAGDGEVTRRARLDAG